MDTLLGILYIHTLGAVILKRRGKPSCCTQDPNKLHWADPRILYIIVTCLAVLVTKGVWCTQIWTYLQFSKLRTKSLAFVTNFPRCTWIALEISLVFVSSRLKGGFPRNSRTHLTLPLPHKNKKTHIKSAGSQNDLQHLEQPLKVVQQSNLRLPARGRACEHVACRMGFLRNSMEQHWLPDCPPVLRKSGRSPLHGDQNFPELDVTL